MGYLLRWAIPENSSCTPQLLPTCAIHTLLSCWAPAPWFSFRSWIQPQDSNSKSCRMTIPPLIRWMAILTWSCLRSCCLCSYLPRDYWLASDGYCWLLTILSTINRTFGRFCLWIPNRSPRCLERVHASPLSTALLCTSGSAWKEKLMRMKSIAPWRCRKK